MIQDQLVDCLTDQTDQLVHLLFPLLIRGRTWATAVISIDKKNTTFPSAHLFFLFLNWCYCLSSTGLNCVKILVHKRLQLRNNCVVYLFVQHIYKIFIYLQFHESSINTALKLTVMCPLFLQSVLLKIWIRCPLLKSAFSTWRSTWV